MDSDVLINKKRSPNCGSYVYVDCSFSPQITKMHADMNQVYWVESGEAIEMNGPEDFVHPV